MAASFCTLMCTGVVMFFTGVVAVNEKDEGEMSTEETKDLQISFVLFSIAATGEDR